MIKGKGTKERLIHICDDHVITALDKYRSEYDSEIHSCGYFFVNSIGNRLSDQSVSEMINKTNPYQIGFPHAPEENPILARSICNTTVFTHDYRQNIVRAWSSFLHS